LPEFDDEPPVPGYPPVGGEVGPPSFQAPPSQPWKPDDWMRLILLVVVCVALLFALFASYVPAAMNGATDKWLGSVLPVITLIIGGFVGYLLPRK
jgi:hypothetical protein